MVAIPRFLLYNNYMKICILGCAPSWEDAPFEDDSIEIWTLNQALLDLVPRFDRHFDVHIPHWYQQPQDYYFKWLQEHQDKLYISDKCELYPKAHIIDHNMLVKKHGSYFTSSIAWMMAVALEESTLSDIYLCGVDLLQKSEYEIQRPCVEFFIGKAKERGIEIHLQNTTTLLKSDKLYGIM